MPRMASAAKSISSSVANQRKTVRFPAEVPRSCGRWGRMQTAPDNIPYSCSTGRPPKRCPCGKIERDYAGTAQAILAATRRGKRR
jgi:hypothetical protein